jgi:hypothetical protein
MSRSDYDEDCEDNWQLIRYRGMVTSALRGRRGQALLRDMVAALDALPQKRLVEGELELPSGEVCALGAVGRLRGIDMRRLDPEDPETVASVLDVAVPLAREVAWENDDAGPWKETPELRCERIRAWAEAWLKKE